MTNFLDDRTPLATGKVSTRIYTTPENERLTPDNWEGVCQALYNVRDKIAYDFTGATAGAGVGETVELLFLGASLQLADDFGYLVTIEAAAYGLIAAAPAVQIFRSTYAVRRTAGVTTIADTGNVDQYGDAAAASWTFAVSVGAGPDRLRMDFTTGATTSAARAKARVVNITKV